MAQLDRIIAAAVPNQDAPFLIAMVGQHDGVAWSGAAGDRSDGNAASHSLHAFRGRPSRYAFGRIPRVGRGVEQPLLVRPAGRRDWLAHDPVFALCRSSLYGLFPVIQAGHLSAPAVPTTHLKASHDHPPQTLPLDLRRGHCGGRPGGLRRQQRRDNSPEHLCACARLMARRLVLRAASPLARNSRAPGHRA